MVRAKVKVWLGYSLRCTYRLPLERQLPLCDGVSGPNKNHQAEGDDDVEPREDRLSDEDAEHLCVQEERESEESGERRGEERR